jgi:transketolase
MQISLAKISRKIIALILVWTLLNTWIMSPVPAWGQGVLIVSPSGQQAALSPAFHPPLLTGIKFEQKDPLRLDFILDRGDTEGQKDAERLIKYFLASLTIPEKDLWVNLSPYEKNRIVPDAFGQTEMGRDLLSQDYLLKQVTASLLYPEGETGKKFWTNVYAEAQKRYGTTDIPVGTFNKVWIVPEKATVYENKNAAFVVESKLKVMLDSDYVAAMQSSHDPASFDLRPATPLGPDMAKDVLREVIIPVLEKEVNEGKNFASLRQVYNSLILAIWYKNKIKSSLFGTVYVDQNKIFGVDIPDKNEKEEIWAKYVEAFKKGAFNLVREEKDELSGEALPRKYFSGGMNLRVPLILTSDCAQLPEGTKHRSMVVRTEMALADHSMGLGAVDHSLRVAGMASAAERIRQTILETVARKHRGHIGGYLSLVDILTAIYFGGGFLYDPLKPHDEMRDQLVLSKAHGGLALYAVLAQAGFFEPKDLIDHYAEPGHRFPVMPTFSETPGVDMSTDLLGAGLGKAVGLAVASKKKGRSNKVVVIVGDGEMAEGAIQESGEIAGQYQLDNLIVIADRNNLGLDGRLTSPAHLNMRARWEAMGFEVIEVDGHDRRQLADVLQQLHNEQRRPVLVIAATEKGRGLSGVAGETHSHYYRRDLHSAVVSAELEREKLFSHGEAFEQWREFLYVNMRAGLALRREQAGYRFPRSSAVADSPEEEVSLEARSLVTDVLKPWLIEAGERNPDLVALAADVTPHVGMAGFKDRFGVFGAQSVQGRMLGLPITEKAMVQLAEGLAHEGFWPIVGMQEAVLLLALSDIRTPLQDRLPFVLIGTQAGLSATNGRGYQDVSISAMMRQMPGLRMLEPSSPAEMRFLLEEMERSRQAGERMFFYMRVSDQRVADMPGVTADDIRQGFYEAGKTRAPQAVVISMGAIAHEALKARELLKSQGLDARVVVINDMARTEQEPEKFLDLLPPGIPVFTVYDGYYRWLADQVAFLMMRANSWRSIASYGPITALGMRGFGATGSWETLIRQFALDAESIAAEVMAKSDRAMVAGIDRFIANFDVAPREYRYEQGRMRFRFRKRGQYSGQLRFIARHYGQIITSRANLLVRDMAGLRQAVLEHDQDATKHSKNIFVSDHALSWDEMRALVQGITSEVSFAFLRNGQVGLSFGESDFVSMPALDHWEMLDPSRSVIAMIHNHNLPPNANEPIYLAGHRVVLDLNRSLLPSSGDFFGSNTRGNGVFNPYGICVYRLHPRMINESTQMLAMVKGLLKEDDKLLRVDAVRHWEEHMGYMIDNVLGSLSARREIVSDDELKSLYEKFGLFIEITPWHALRKKNVVQTITEMDRRLDERIGKADYGGIKRNLIAFHFDVDERILQYQEERVLALERQMREERSPDQEARIAAKQWSREWDRLFVLRQFASPDWQDQRRRDVALWLRQGEELYARLGPGPGADYVLADNSQMVLDPDDLTNDLIARHTALREQEIKALEGEFPQFNWRLAAEVPWPEVIRDIRQQPHGPTDDAAAERKFGSRENQQVYWDNNVVARRHFLVLVRDLLRREGGAFTLDEYQGRLYAMYVAMRQARGLYASDFGGEMRVFDRVLPGLHKDGRSQMERIFVKFKDLLRARRNLGMLWLLKKAADFYRELLADDYYMFGQGMGNNSLHMNMLNGIFRLYGMNGVSHDDFDLGILYHHHAVDQVRKELLTALKERNPDHPELKRTYLPSDLPLVAGVFSSSDPAQKGGIDLSGGKGGLKVETKGEESEFFFDPALIARIRSAPGLRPVILGIEPMRMPVAEFLSPR